MRLFSGLRIRSSHRTRARLCRCLSLARAALCVSQHHGREGLPPRMVGMEWTAPDRWHGTPTLFLRLRSVAYVMKLCEKKE